MDQILANDDNCSLIVANERAPQSLFMHTRTNHIHPTSRLPFGWLARLGRAIGRLRAPPRTPSQGWPARERAHLPEGWSSLLLLAALPSACVPGPALGARHAAGASASAQAGAAPSVAVSPEAASVVAFWREAGPTRWFAKDPAFDRLFRERFLALHEAAMRGELMPWRESAEGSLALIILLDQFPRNAFRGTPRMYASDGFARVLADVAIRAGHDRRIEPDLRVFMYLPFGHSERLEDQERSLELVRSLGEPHLSHAQGHHDIVERFGRFPHRNPILGRAMRPEEQKFLDEGGYSG
jgi:uncharacterized protein (DUF924 family)